MSGGVAFSWHGAADAPPATWSVGVGGRGLGVRESEAQSGRAGAAFALQAASEDAPPGVVSVELRAPRFAVRSYVLRPLADGSGRSASAAPKRATPTTGASPARYTRFKPPEDVIKLQDRLALVLEPPLELLLAGDCLEFPVRPFPFQLDGVAFLYPRHAALLADEMGLGKTMQAITAIRLLFHARQARRVLVVCPKPLVTNWRRELQTWAPELPLVIVEGNRSRRHFQWQAADAPVRIANYELLRRDADFVTAAERFDLVVLDESQRIKNRAGATSQVVRAIPRERSWALTGTPVENSSDDLVGIFDFLAPGHLNAGMAPRRMGRLTSDYVLRRTKAQVLTDLPPKLIRDAEVELSPEQRESYRLAEEQGVLRLTAMGEAATIHHVFELILRLKQICNFDPATGTSSKFERLVADVEEVAASGQKALVFSQWVETLTVLRRRLARFGPMEYHGSVPAARRDDVLAEFRDDPRHHVLLISYGAGGVGLNLQFASYVFLFDRWWNPAVEDQAINRAHRIGAEGPVTITRFLSLSTIEERIEQVLRDKRELFDAIFSGASAPRLGLSQQEIFGLFRLKCPTGPITAAG
ncbi:MAG: DEAD/DEAH box helicase [Planctomycetia bacterium]|nr:DEAD/DEAH box helicase [Planctomycetia bacterium]